MFKSLGFLALWLAGTATAVAVAWAGVSVVDSELINPAPANVLALPPDSALRPDTVETLGSAETAPTSSPEAVSESASTSTVSASAVSSTAPPATTSSPAATSPASTSAAPITSTTTARPTSSTAPPSTTTTAPPTTPSTTTTPTTTTPPTTTTTTAPQTQTLTFHLVGGSTSIAFSPAGATVLWASPNPGFAVDIDHGAESRVEFESDGHKTRIDAWWSGGPQHEIREDAD